MSSDRDQPDLATSLDEGASSSKRVTLRPAELDHYKRCRREQALSLVLPITVGLPAVSYMWRRAKGRLFTIQRGIGLATFGAVVGIVSATVRCVKKTAQAFPDGVLVQKMRRQMESFPGAQQGIGNAQQGLEIEPDATQQYKPQRSDDYTSGFADSHSNVQFEGLPDSGRRTVDDDSFPIGRTRQGSGDTDSSIRKMTYAELREQTRAENRRAEEGPAVDRGGSGGAGDFMSNQKPAKSQEPARPTAPQWYQLPERSDVKPVRRNKWGDIVDE